jgi:hypothetical protein
MRKLILTLIGFTWLVVSCTKDKATTHYTFYRPVYETKEQVRASIKSAAPETVQKPGKMVVKDHYVYLNDVDKGIHVIDLRDPGKPVNIGFIRIPGCEDLAINGNYLYADCYTDLVTIDISDPVRISLVQALPGVFPHRIYYNFFPDTSKIITTWIRVDTAITTRFEQNFETVAESLRKSGGLYMSQAFSSPGNIGIAGSMARFALLNNRMYTVSWADLKVFNITQATTPKYVQSVTLTQGSIETIFPYKDNLFIGSRTGMYIYNTTNPDQPGLLAQFTHVRSCDPVIADDGYAYITLKGGSACGGFTNQLDIVSLKDLLHPVALKSYSLNAPEGLSKDRGLLFICDGAEGLKIFNASDPANLVQLSQVKGFYPTDVIALGGVAIATAKDGLYCIDYSDAANAKIVGKIPVIQTN